MNNNDNHVVIMAGGIGSRFWPLSTPEYPKQFVDVLGCGRTLLQMTADRFEGICPPENIWVVTNASYVDIVKRQLPHIPEHHILPEPEARNTAPCIAWAGWSVYVENHNANIVVAPADALVLDQAEFRKVITECLEHTRKNDVIVTVGIKPSRPETGYGYVGMGQEVDGEIHAVTEFKEKPDLETAKEYVESGRYLWNAGIFVWSVKVLLDNLSFYKPRLTINAKNILRTGDAENIFPLCEKISIDYAVMEPAARDGKVYTHPADFGWSDLGNWASLHDKLARDENGNAAVGNVFLHECKDCIVHAEGAKRVVLQGLDGYIVSEKNGCILVCKRSEEQRIKEFSAE